jgi:pimeloyl-ACP methyl ester carboxylesterase
MPNSFDFPVRSGSNQKKAILFVHGFSGDAHLTFGMLPAFLAGDRTLEDWDLYCFGYPTGLSPDVTGVWSADPDLTTLAGLLREHCNNKLTSYSKLAVIAHSMGGLIVQRAILEADMTTRISHLALFGTPSAGLRKAGLGSIFKRQARDMAAGGVFVTKLRADWSQKFQAGMPFAFRAIAGVKDEFVPVESSVKPFPGYEGFVNGNHLEIVKPETPTSDTTVLLKLFLSQASGAARAITTPAAKQAGEDVTRLSADTTNLTDEQLVKLVFGLEMQGKQEESIRLLRQFATRSTELTSVLAGRLKRRWLADPEQHLDEGLEAGMLYRRAFSRAAQEGNHSQAFYAGINAAFMAAVLEKDLDQARTTAIRVIEHCRLSPVEKWQLATQAEANLYMGDIDASVAYYQAALEAGPNMREIESMEKQAIWVARVLKSAEAESRLQKLFEAGPR